MSSIRAENIIRTSDRGNFRRCRRLWKYTSPLKHNLEPVRQNKNLEFGIAVHEGLAAFYAPENWGDPWLVKASRCITAFKDINKTQRLALGDYSNDQQVLADYQEREELGVSMLNYYCHWATKHDDFTPVAVESLVRRVLPFDFEATYQVRMDLLLVDNNGGYWYMDHKTTKSFYSTEWLDVDTQFPSYLPLIEEHYGVKLEGFIYNELRKVNVEEPRVLKSGGISVDKRQTTTPELFLKALKRQNLTLEDNEKYVDYLEYLRGQDDPLVRRTQVYQSPIQVESHQRHIEREAYEMLTLPDSALYPNPNKMHCNNCPFLIPCMVENEGGDYKSILDDPSLYRPRQGEPEDDDI